MAAITANSLLVQIACAGEKRLFLKITDALLAYGSALSWRRWTLVAKSRPGRQYEQSNSSRLKRMDGMETIVFYSGIVFNTSCSTLDQHSFHCDSLHRYRRRSCEYANYTKIKCLETIASFGFPDMYPSYSTSCEKHATRGPSLLRCQCKPRGDSKHSTNHRLPLCRSASSVLRQRSL
jgi:hypothetical protein